MQGDLPGTHPHIGGTKLSSSIAFPPDTGSCPTLGSRAPAALENLQGTHLGPPTHPGPTPPSTHTHNRSAENALALRTKHNQGDYNDFP
eukprot:4713013-Amphidinium_carterae.2